MKNWQKPVLVNVVIVAVLLFMNLITTSSNNSGGELFGRFAMSGMLMILMAPVNLVIGIVRSIQHKGDGAIYILISGLLLLIGFSVCTIR